MAVLFVAQAHGEWMTIPLSENVFVITADPQMPVCICSDRNVGSHSPLLLRVETGTSVSWALLNLARNSSVRINGIHPLFPIRVLQHRDEIALGNARLYLSLEHLARVQPFPETAEPVHCPRCRQIIRLGTPSVQCPQCGVWHHETGNELPCWTYSERCSLCDQPTLLDGAYRWTPEGL